MKKIIFSVILLTCVISVCSANQVQIESQNSIATISLITENPLQLGAFDIQLNYSVSDTNVEKIDGLEPFSLITDIDNSRGIVKIAGFAYPDPHKSTNTRMVTLLFNGTGKFDLIVWEIVDTNVQIIPVSNPSPVTQVTSTDIVTQTPPAYNLNDPQYSNPMAEYFPSNQNKFIPNSYNNPVSLPNELSSPIRIPEQIAIITPVIEKTPDIGNVQLQTPGTQSIADQGGQELTLVPQQTATTQHAPSSIILSISGLLIVGFIYLKGYV